MGKTMSIIILLMLVTSIVMFQPVKAKGNVITVPDDFLTINDAIQNATDGDTIFIKKGIYNETLFIDKRLTLRGEDTNKTIINGNCSGTVIQIIHDGVTVTGLTIIYSYVANMPTTYFQHNPLSNWTYTWKESMGYPKDSGYFTRYGEWRLAGLHLLSVFYCNITGNIIMDNGPGIWLYQSRHNSISGNVFIRNDYALQIEDSGSNIIFGNTFENGGGGVWFWFTSNWLNALGNSNGSHPVNNRFFQNNFIDNIKPLEKQAMTNASQNIWDNDEKGNYWSDYKGIDSNGDGIGDSSYPIIGEDYTGGVNRAGKWIDEVCGEDRYPLMQPFNTTSMFIVNADPSEQQPNLNLTSLEYIAAIMGIIVIAALVIYFRKHK